MRTWTAALVLLIAAGCGGGDDAAVPTTGEPREIREGAVLPPGLYTLRRFEPSVVLRLGPGWRGGHTFPEYFDVSVENSLIGFGRFDQALTADGEGRPLEGLVPSSAAELIAANSDVDAGSVADASIGGETGASVEFRPKFNTQLLTGPAGVYRVFTTSRYRFTFVEVDGVLVLVGEETTAEPYDEGLRRTGEVAASVRFP
jgi:hypothetical protein